MKQSAIVYLATLIIAFPLDFVFLRAGGLLFGANAREVILDGPRSAILFYVIYVACIVSFVNAATPENWTENTSRGAQLGLFSTRPLNWQALFCSGIGSGLSWCRMSHGGRR
jgi:uncharacterized membrane protein